MIQILDISDNNFEEPIPPGLCLNSTGIKVLKLGVNYFNGVIPPEFEKCSSLEILSLDANFVSRIIPEYIFRFPRLSQMYLQDNNLIGQLCNSNPSNFVNLDVSLNSLSGNLPDIFHTFLKLTYFDANSNNLSGMIPSSLLNSPSISSLILRNNSLSGSIDLNFSAMINLDFLDLAFKKFIGFVPDNLPSCLTLETIYLDGNNLTGQIPVTFKRFNSLSHISISRLSLKNLSVSLEILQRFPNLTTLALTISFDNDDMPSVANLQFKMLENLLIHNSSLTGMIPMWLNGLTKLKILDVSCSQLKGHITPFLGNLPSLVHLNLSDNFLSGGIPERFTRLKGLRFLHISFQVLVDLPIFTRRSMSGKLMPYSSGIPLSRPIDLSNNSLTGPMWPEFGNLISLQILNLKYNELSGNIPSKLADLLWIQTMDLSYNSLSGGIPHSLVRLNFLSKFSVAYNNLTGVIPYEGQFLTFLKAIFEGNPGLCGDFVLKCNKVQGLLQTPVTESKKYFVIGLPEWIGFGIGFLLMVVILLFSPTIRDI